MQLNLEATGMPNVNWDYLKIAYNIYDVPLIALV
jgi:hypothetical protein